VSVSYFLHGLLSTIGGKVIANELTYARLIKHYSS